MKKIIVILLIVSISGCASKSKNISAAYVSPLQYQHYNCEQVGQELGRVSRKVNETSAIQDSSANKDALAMTVGLVIFWPALFFLAGGDKKDELSRMKGEYDALEGIAIEKNCTTVLASIDAAKQRQAEIEKSQKLAEANSPPQGS